jgi:hypothetical protein
MKIKLNGNDRQSHCNHNRLNHKLQTQMTLHVSLTWYFDFQIIPFLSPIICILLTMRWSLVQTKRKLEDAKAVSETVNLRKDNAMV